MTDEGERLDPAEVMRARDPEFRAVVHELRSYVSGLEPLWDQAITKIDSDPEAAFEDLVALEIQIRHFAMIALDNLLDDVDAVEDALDGPSPDDEPTFEDVNRLLSGDAEDREWAAQQLVRFDSDDTRTRLRALLTDPDEDVRGSVAQTLALLGVRDALPDILRLLANDDGARVSATRWAAATLAKGHPSDWDAVVNALQRIKLTAAPDVQQQIDLLLAPDKRRSRKPLTRPA